MKLYGIKEIIPIVIILVVLGFGMYLYPTLPDRMPTHWGIDGQVNGWSSKNFAVFFFPALILGIYLLMSFFPLMDPHKENIESFAGVYFWFKVVLVVFLAFIYMATIFASRGWNIDIGRMVSFGVALLFIFIGAMLPSIKKNYTIGIRLPWTLHSEVVWEKTHKFGGAIFASIGVAVLVADLFSSFYAFIVLMVGMPLLLIGLTVYSYLEFKKLNKK
jgi:uncharacterized membrane protein